MIARAQSNDPTLPWDVLEVIVDTVSLQKGRFESLKALSLVSSSLVSKCRQYIFEEVELDGRAHLGLGFSYPRPNSSRIQAFLALIESAGPASSGLPIQDYVRVLRIDNNPSPLIFRIAALLPNLECLLLKTGLSRYEERIALDYEASHRLTDGQVDSERAGGWLHANPEIEQLRTDCYEELDNLRLRPQPPLHLDRLYVRQWHSYSDETFNYLARCLYLQTRIWDSWYPEDIEETVTNRVVTVRRLELHNATETFKIMLGMPHTQAFFSAVEYLTVKLHRYETPGDTLRLLSAAQGTLLGLSLNVTRYPYRSCAPIAASLDLGSFVKLRHLILINWPRNPEQPQFAFPESLLSLLSTFSASSSVLESVALTITWDRWDLDADWDEDGSWRRAQGLVIDPQGKRRSGFATLKSCKVRVEVRELGKGKRFRGRLHTQAAAKRAKILFSVGDEIAGGIAFPALQV